MKTKLPTFCSNERETNTQEQKRIGNGTVVKTDLRGWWVLSTQGYCYAAVFASHVTGNQELLWSERPSYFLFKSCFCLSNCPFSLLVVTIFSSSVAEGMNTSAEIYSNSAALRDKMGQVLGSMVGGRLVVAADFLASIYPRELRNSHMVCLLHFLNFYRMINSY